MVADTRVTETLPVDYSLGVTIRMHPEGFDVNMYKAEPGVFMDNRGNPVSLQIALEAGFDTKQMSMLKEKQDRIRDMKASIEREYGVPADEIVAEAGGYKAISLGNGLYSITDEDGNVLTDAPMGRDDAVALVTRLAPDDAVDEYIAPTPVEALLAPEPALSDFDVEDAAADLDREAHTLTEDQIPSSRHPDPVDARAEVPHGIDLDSRDYAVDEDGREIEMMPVPTAKRGPGRPRKAK